MLRENKLYCRINTLIIKKDLPVVFYGGFNHGFDWDYRWLLPNLPLATSIGLFVIGGAYIAYKEYQKRGEKMKHLTEYSLYLFKMESLKRYNM